MVGPEMVPPGPDGCADRPAAPGRRRGRRCSMRRAAAARGRPAEIRRPGRLRSPSPSWPLAASVLIRLAPCQVASPLAETLVRARRCGLDRHRRCRSRRKIAMNAAEPPHRRAQPVLLRETTAPIAMLDAQPAGGAQQPVGGAAGRARRGVRRASQPTQRCAPWCSRANGPAFCAGHDLKELTARRTDADGGRAYFQHIMTTLQRDDAADRHPAAAGDRRGAGHRHRRRLPARRELRSRRRLGDGALRHARRRYRPVLLDADGGAVAQRRRASTRWRCC